VLADEAYLHLRYDPGEPALLAATDPGAPILTVGTFSKTIAPGLRVAWMAGPTPVINRLALLKQVTDLHSSSLTQRLVHRYVAAGHLPAQVAHLRSAYRLLYATVPDLKKRDLDLRVARKDTKVVLPAASAREATPREPSPAAPGTR